MTDSADWMAIGDRRGFRSATSDALACTVGRSRAARHTRACLLESRELSTALGYQSALDLVWATGIASRTRDRAATLELGRRAIRGLSGR